MSSESLEFIKNGISKLRHYLAVLVAASLILIVLNNYIIFNLEKSVNELKPIEIFQFYVYLIPTLIFWIIPQLVYYFAINSLVHWSEKFTAYKLLVGVFIAILVIQRALSMYQLYGVINEYNIILAQMESVSVDPLYLYGLTTVYELTIGSVFTIALIGVLNMLIRESAKIPQITPSSESTRSSGIEEPCGKSCKLSEATVYLKLSQVHFIVGGIFAFIYLDMKIPGLVILFFGLLLLIKGSVDSIRRLGEFLEHIKPPAVE